MMNKLRTNFARLFVVVCFLLPSMALGQTVLQGGPTTPYHMPMYAAGQGSQAIIQDSGIAAGGPLGSNPTELGLTTRNPAGTYPAVNVGTGPLFTNLCTYDAPTSNPTGDHFLCFGPNSNGGGLIAYGAEGGAPALPLVFNVNGTSYTFPFLSSGVIGPNTSVVNDFACWNNTSGTLLKDCGPIVVTVPVPTASTLGGLFSGNASAGSFVTGVNTSGVLQYTNLLGVSNNWSATQTFAAPPIFSSLTGFLYGNGAGAITANPYVPQDTATLDLDVSKIPGVDITGATDSTAGINTALTTALASNRTLYFPCGIYVVSGSGTEVFLVTNKALNLRGANNNCTYFNTSGVGATTTVWHQVLAGAITGTSIQNISINVGGGQNFYKLDGGATGYIQHLTIHDFIGGTSFTGPVVSLNATAGNTSGAIAYSTIYNNIFNSLYCAYCGDGVAIDHNTFGGALPGIEMSFVSGAAGASITKNIIVNSGGQLILHNGVGITILHNEFEAAFADTSPHNAIIDLQGDISQILGADFKDNSVSVLLAAGTPGPDAVRIDNVDNFHVAGGRISLYQGVGLTYHIRNTASSTNTNIAQTDIRFETIVGSGSAMRMFNAGGYNSVCSPSFSAPSTSTVLHGNATLGCGAFGAVALTDMATEAANSILGNNTGSPATPVALTVAQVKTLLAIVRADITDWGTGVQTALGINVGTAGAVVVNGGALGTPSSGTGTNLTGIPTTGLTGILQAAQFPALTGDATTTAGSLATTVGKIGGKAVTLGGALTFSGAFGTTLTVVGTTALTLPTSGTLAILGSNTFTGAQINSTNGAASAPPMALTGTIFAGGSSTTTKPQLLVEPAGTTSTGWSVAGTLLGLNAPSGFTGNLLDLQLAGVSQTYVTSAGLLVANTLFSTGAVSATGSVFSGSNFVGQADASGIYLGAASDLILVRAGAANLRLGSYDAAAPVAQTFSVQSVVTGTTNTAGQNLTILGSVSTGSGVSGDIIIKTGGTGAGATAQNSQVTAATIKGATQQAIFAGSVKTLVTVVGSLPSASTAGAGSRAFVTDGSTTVILGLGLTVAGGGANKVPVYSDGTNWIVG